LAAKPGKEPRAAPEFYFVAVDEPFGLLDHFGIVATHHRFVPDEMAANSYLLGGVL
jgi:hypothetical protein